jgi:hypothetical protein
MRGLASLDRLFGCLRRSKSSPSPSIPRSTVHASRRTYGAAFEYAMTLITCSIAAPSIRRWCAKRFAPCHVVLPRLLKVKLPA